jgi:signal transduction histidine kinase
MEALIDDMLTLARDGSAIEELEPLQLAVVAQTAWANVATEGATLRTETNRQLAADPGRLQQLLENLFRNAVEHAGPAVTVTVGSTTEGFYVADDGPGVPEPDRAQIFDARYSTEAENTGLGLRIVHDIAAAHGWEVTVTDAQPSGARFEVTGVDFLD